MSRLLWTQKQHVGPIARVGHGMVYDESRVRVVLFGGETLRAPFNDTWEWDGSHWTQMADMGPGARFDHAMAYDVDRGHTLMFGGSGAAIFGDTWAWNGDEWTQLVDTGPTARAGTAVTYDRARSRVVLFGGAPSASPAPANDTWEWDGSDWTQVEDTGPSGRFRHAMAYDAQRSRVVLFGGTGTDGLGLSDTWEWDGSEWTRLADFGPGPCLGASMAYKGDAVALFGGINSVNASPTVFANTWQWDGAHWSLVQNIGPGPRWRHALAYDANNSHIVLFGGLPVGPNDPNAADRVLGDTWLHSDAASGPPVTIQAFAVSPVSVVAPGSTTGTITLSGPAPSGGVTVQLTSDRTDPRLTFTPGAQVTVPSQSTSATVSIGFTGSPQGPVGFDITATLGKSSQEAIVTFLP